MVAQGDGFTWQDAWKIAEGFIITPKERMEHEAAMARVNADVSIALASAREKNATVNTVMIAGGVLVAGIVAWKLLT